jgi:hypothetical protein
MIEQVAAVVYIYRSNFGFANCERRLSFSFFNGSKTSDFQSIVNHPDQSSDDERCRRLLTSDLKCL